MSDEPEPAQLGGVQDVLGEWDAGPPTPLERAQAIYKLLDREGTYRGHFPDDDPDVSGLERHIASEIERAVRAEREACAALVEGWKDAGLSHREHDLHFGTRYDAPSIEKIAAAIRART